MMTKKHFKKIAQILSDGYGMTLESLARITTRFADFLGNENPRFDRQRFVDAVYAEDKKADESQLLECEKGGDENGI